MSTTRAALVAVFAAQAVLLAFALKLRLSYVLKQQDVRLSSWQGEGRGALLTANTGPPKMVLLAANTGTISTAANTGTISTAAG